jgi:hypothetical protein
LLPKQFGIPVIPKVGTSRRLGRLALWFLLFPFSLFDNYPAFVFSTVPMAYGFPLNPSKPWSERIRYVHPSFSILAPSLVSSQSFHMGLACSDHGDRHSFFLIQLVPIWRNNSTLSVARLCLPYTQSHFLHFRLHLYCRSLHPIS